LSSVAKTSVSSLTRDRLRHRLTRLTSAHNYSKQTVLANKIVHSYGRRRRGSESSRTFSLPWADTRVVGGQLESEVAGRFPSGQIPCELTVHDFVERWGNRIDR
jgi:hypothetical protein